MGKPLFVIFDMDAYYQSQGTSSDGTSVSRPKIPDGGGGNGGRGVDDWNSYSYNIYTDVEGLKQQLRTVFRGGKAIPGQPVNQKGKPYSYFIYNTLRSLWMIWTM